MAKARVRPRDRAPERAGGTSPSPRLRGAHSTGGWPVGASSGARTCPSSCSGPPSSRRERPRPRGRSKARRAAQGSAWRGGRAGARREQPGALAPAPHSPDRPRRLPRTGRQPESRSGSGRVGRPIAPRAPNFPPIAAALSRWADRQGPGRGSADGEFCATSSRHPYSPPAFSLALHAVLLGPLSSRPSVAVVPTGTSGVGGLHLGDSLQVWYLGLRPPSLPSLALVTSHMTGG